MGGIVDSVGGLITGESAGEAESAAAINEMRKAGALTAGVELPDYAKMKLALETPELLEEYDPEELGSSAFEDIQLTPEVKDAQLQALEQIRELGTTGLGPEDMAAARELSRQVGRQEKARQDTILQQMAQRGTLDGGASLAAQLSSSQAAANRQAQAADRIAAESAAARRQALSQAMQASSGLRGQEFQEKAQQAQAKDIINRFNVQAGQQAQLRNIAERQRIAEKGMDIRSQQQQYNKGLERQQFLDELSKATGQAQSAQGMAQMQAQRGAGKAAAQAQQTAGLMSLGGTLGAAAMMAPAASDKNLKENIEPTKSDELISKLEEMLDSLKAYKYDYKEPEKYGEGEQMSVMAQDLEKSDLGSEFVEDTSEGKMVDYSKMAPTMLASLADLHDRLKKVEGE
jgi:hypothetical protein